VEGEEVYRRRWWILTVLWRGGAVIPAASAPGEELGYLTHHRVFACLSGNCGLQKITGDGELVRSRR
jgi:hypothetical protein